MEIVAKSVDNRLGKDIVSYTLLNSDYENQVVLRENELKEKIRNKDIVVNNAILCSDGTLKGKYYSLDCILQYKNGTLCNFREQDVCILRVHNNGIAVILMWSGVDEVELDTLLRGQYNILNIKSLKRLINASKQQALKDKVRRQRVNMQKLLETVGDRNIEWSITEFKGYMDYKGYEYGINHGELSGVSCKCEIVHVPVGITKIQNLFEHTPSQHTQLIISYTVTEIGDLVKNRGKEVIKLRNIWFQGTKYGYTGNYKGIRYIEFSDICNMPCGNTINGIYNDCKVWVKSDRRCKKLTESFSNCTESVINIRVKSMEFSFSYCKQCKILVKGIHVRMSFRECSNCIINVSTGESHSINNEVVYESLNGDKNCSISVCMMYIKDSLNRLTDCRVDIRDDEKYAGTINLGSIGDWCSNTGFGGDRTDVMKLPACDSVIISELNNYKRIELNMYKGGKYSTYKFSGKPREIVYNINSGCEVDTCLFSEYIGGSVSNYDNTSNGSVISIRSRQTVTRLTGSRYSNLTHEIISMLPKTITDIESEVIYQAKVFDSADFPSMSIIKKETMTLNTIKYDCSNSNALRTLILDSNIREIESLGSYAFVIEDLFIGDGIERLSDSMIDELKSVCGYGIRIAVIKGGRIENILRINGINTICVSNSDEARLLFGLKCNVAYKQKLRLLIGGESWEKDIIDKSSDINVRQVYFLERIYRNDERSLRIKSAHEDLDTTKFINTGFSMENLLKSKNGKIEFNDKPVVLNTEYSKPVVDTVNFITNHYKYSDKQLKMLELNDGVEYKCNALLKCKGLSIYEVVNVITSRDDNIVTYMYIEYDNKVVYIACVNDVIMNNTLYIRDKFQLCGGSDYIDIGDRYILSTDTTNKLFSVRVKIHGCDVPDEYAEDIFNAMLKYFIHVKADKNKETIKGNKKGTVFGGISFEKLEIYRVYVSDLVRQVIIGITIRSYTNSLRKTICGYVTDKMSFDEFLAMEAKQGE